MKLSCPTCASSFAVPADLLGPKGRKVKCASCGHVWRAFPTDDVSQDQIHEPEMVDDFVAVPEQGIAADFAAIHPQETDLVSVQRASDIGPDAMKMLDEEALSSGPVAGGLLGGKARKPGPVKLKGHKRGAKGEPRLVVPLWASKAGRAVAKASAPVGVAAGLTLLALSVTQRDATVRLFPDLAPLYEMAGLDVNVRGVSFSQFTAQREVLSGISLLRIEGEITNTEIGDVPLGALRLALLSQSGAELFVWRLEPDLAGLMPGQSLPITSELTAPPEAVASVSVRFLQDNEQVPGEAL